MTTSPSLYRPRSRLRLRPPAVIAWAYVLGPTAGLTVLFLLIVIRAMFDPAHTLAGMARTSLAFFFIYLLIFGGLICLVVELVVITPLLVGFHRYGWSWLNGWTGALIGFALGVVPSLLLDAVTRSYSAYAYGANRTWTEIAGAIELGLVGAVAAGVFRLLAVRRVDADDAP